MNTVFEEISKTYPKLSYFNVDAEELSDLAEVHEIEMVPTFIAFLDGKELERVEGADPQKLTALATKYAALTPSSVPKDLQKLESKPIDLNQRLTMLVNSHPVMLFMKGTPNQPRCGFSRQIVEILSKAECTYGSFDILADDQVRQGLKTFSDWPTFPQLYINGEFVGGLDIVKEMNESGELKQLLPQEPDLNTRLKALINQAPVMLFMKGSPDVPKCGFSRTLVGVLKDVGCQFETFDILTDEEIRQGLKVYSDWPTFPQLYIKGELIGGLDIVKELVESGEFSNML